MVNKAKQRDARTARPCWRRKWSSDVTLDAFGRRIVVLRLDGGWRVFDQGNEGKRRVARDIVIPASVPEEEIVGYISDLLHEYATPQHPEVFPVE